MTSATMSDNDRKAELSFACLSALSSVAGFTCQRGPQPDAFKVDAILRSGRNQIDVQLKSTSSPRRLRDGLHFQVDRQLYDTLRDESRSFPIILAVLELPKERTQWIERTPESLMLRRCLWWDSLTGYPEIQSGTKVIVIPETQQLDPGALERLMEQTRQGRPLKE